MSFVANSYPRRKKSLDMLVEASIDRLFDNCVRKVQAQVDRTMRELIGDTLLYHPGSKAIKAAIKTAFDKELDVLLDFEVKFMRYFKEALADAVAELVAKRHKRDLLDQLTDF